MKNKQEDLVQIAGVLRDLEIGLPESEICERHGVTVETLRAWCAQYGQDREERVARMRALEEENARLRRLTKELAADKEVAKDILDRIEQMERKARKKFTGKRAPYPIPPIPASPAFRAPSA